MARKLIDLIEKHAEELTDRLVHQLKTHRLTIGLRKYDDLELGHRAHELYSHLGVWLRSTSEPAVQDAFAAFGVEERALDIPLSDLVGALILTRRNLWEFIEQRSGDSAFDLRQEVDLVMLVIRFFDRAIYYTVRGYESADGKLHAPAGEAAGHH